MLRQTKVTFDEALANCVVGGVRRDLQLSGNPPEILAQLCRLFGRTLTTLPEGIYLVTDDYTQGTLPELTPPELAQVTTTWKTQTDTLPLTDLHLSRQWGRLLSTLPQEQRNNPSWKLPLGVLGREQKTLVFQALASYCLGEPRQHWSTFSKAAPWLDKCTIRKGLSELTEPGKGTRLVPTVFVDARSPLGTVHFSQTLAIGDER